MARVGVVVEEGEAKMQELRSMKRKDNRVNLPIRPHLILNLRRVINSKVSSLSPIRAPSHQFPLAI